MITPFDNGSASSAIVLLFGNSCRIHVSYEEVLMHTPADNVTWKPYLHRQMHVRSCIILLTHVSQETLHKASIWGQSDGFVMKWLICSNATDGLVRDAWCLFIVLGIVTPHALGPTVCVCGVQSIPMQLLPGAPTRVSLQAGHPFEESAPGLETKAVPSFEAGAAIPPFAVLATDAFGNVCVPSPSLTWSIEVHSIGLSPSPMCFAPDLTAATTVQGMHATHGVKKDAKGGCPVNISVVPVSQALGLQTAVNSAKPKAESAVFRILLAPSDVPMELTLQFGGTELPYADVDHDGITRRTFQVCSLETLPLVIRAMHVSRFLYA
jgi:hypothetical protein